MIQEGDKELWDKFHLMKEIESLRDERDEYQKALYAIQEHQLDTVELARTKTTYQIAEQVLMKYPIQNKSTKP